MKPKPSRSTSRSVRSSPSTEARRAREQAAYTAAKLAALRRDATTVLVRPGQLPTPLAGKCLPCLLDVRLPDGSPGSGLREDYNHCIPRSRLPGEANWPLLHSPANLAPTCRAHHDAYDRQPAWWLPLMQVAFPQYTAEYAQAPFARYLSR